MDNVLTIAEERLNLFARMANSACGLSLWCFGMKKQLYTCTCPAEKEFRLFLDLGQCLDYAIAHGPESHAPILMSDPIGMLWVAECVWHGDDASYLVILGPVFDAAASLQTLQNCLRGMNLSVSLTATIMEKLEQVPILPLSTLHQYIKMLHWVLYEETLDVGSIRLQNRSNIIPDKEESPYPWDPDRARVVEAQIMQRIREGDIYYPDNSKGMGRFADKDSYNLGNPLRESKDTAIIFTALCARAAMEGGLSPRIAKQLEVQYIRAIEQWNVAARQQRGDRAARGRLPSAVRAAAGPRRPDQPDRRRRTQTGASRPPGHRRGGRGPRRHGRLLLLGLRR